MKKFGKKQMIVLALILLLILPGRIMFLKKYDAKVPWSTASLMDFLGLHKHKYEIIEVDPTWSGVGYSTLICRCGDSYVCTDKDIIGEHKYENGVCSDCGEEEPVKTLFMYYDDHCDIADKTVEVVDAGSPVSCQVGYGVAEGIRDTAVVKVEDGYLIATGTGTGKIRIDGMIYEIYVEPAPVSLLLLIGQSNMWGSEGDEGQSIICPKGTVYSTCGDSSRMTASNAADFVPSALTGTGSKSNVNGTTVHLEDWPIDMLNAQGNGKKGPDSGFAYEWVKQTGEKVWVINAAHSGQSITTWQKDGDNYQECVALVRACQDTLRKEMEAGHYTLSHMGYFWCQGCSDYSQTAEWYVEKYLAMHNRLKKDLAFGENITFEFGGVIPVRAGYERYISYRQGKNADAADYAYYESFRDLMFTGPRAAQYWMTNNPNLPDIWNVCNIGDSWVWMPDGTNGVKAYFQEHYPNGVLDYITQMPQSDAWHMPSTPNDVHKSIHYTQIGYNEIGREAARNALIGLGEIVEPEQETTVKFLTWDGYSQVESVVALTTGQSGTLVVPVVEPVWKSKSVTYTLSEGLHWEYYDLLAENIHTAGSLRADGTDEVVQVKNQKPGAYLEGHLCAMTESICKAMNLWEYLEHDACCYTDTSGWYVHESGEISSITFPVVPGNRIYVPFFDREDVSVDLRITFLGDYGAVQTLDSSETYGEYKKNGGYLITPEEAIAVCIPLFRDRVDNAVYILDREHCYENASCIYCNDYVGPIITQQPIDESAESGAHYAFEVKAEGRSLEYRWYFRNAGTGKWNRSYIKESVYEGIMTQEKAGREVYCVITDTYGNQITTQKAVLRLAG